MLTGRQTRAGLVNWIGRSRVPIELGQLLRVPDRGGAGHVSRRGSCLMCWERSWALRRRRSRSRRSGSWGWARETGGQARLQQRAHDRRRSEEAGGRQDRRRRCGRAAEYSASGGEIWPAAETLHGTLVSHRGKWTGGREQGVAWVDCGGSLL
jgi:hypothetical protein